jgi:hypothetical protein
MAISTAGIFQNVWIRVALFGALVVGGIREAALVLGGIDTTLSLVVLVIWLFELLATPWAGLILIGVVVLMLWRGIRQVEAAAAKGRGVDEAREAERLADRNRFAELQRELIDRLSASLQQQIGPMSHIIMEWCEIVALRDEMNNLHRLSDLHVRNYRDAVTRLRSGGPQKLHHDQGQDPLAHFLLVHDLLSIFPHGHGLTELQRPKFHWFSVEGEFEKRFDPNDNQDYFRIHGENADIIARFVGSKRQEMEGMIKKLEEAAAIRLRKMRGTVR